MGVEAVPSLKLLSRCECEKQQRQQQVEEQPSQLAEVQQAVAWHGVGVELQEWVWLPAWKVLLLDHQDGVASLW